MSARQVRRFQLERDVDVSGVSGTGAVAYGVQAPDGTCVLWWNSEHDSIAIYPSMETLLAIHGHGGMTRAVYIDEPPAPEDGAGAAAGGMAAGERKAAGNAAGGAARGGDAGGGSPSGSSDRPRGMRAGGIRSGAVQGRAGAARLGAGRGWRPRVPAARGASMTRKAVRAHARASSALPSAGSPGAPRQGQVRC